MAEISSASEEQAAGLEQVNKAVTQMDEMTQQNAALVEEAAAASESLGEQAIGLDELVSFFDVGQRTSIHAISKSKKSEASQLAATRNLKPQPAMNEMVSVDEDESEWAQF